MYYKEKPFKHIRPSEVYEMVFKVATTENINLCPIYPAHDNVSSAQSFNPP